jgi:hypothetical protein
MELAQDLVQFFSTTHHFHVTLSYKQNTHTHTHNVFNSNV